jgi:protein subunit release factor B
MISKDKWDALQERMHKLDITEADLIEKFVLGSGTGGQKMNKTSSCVYLKHTPTNIEIKCQQGRSQEANRFYARRLLCEKIEEILYEKKSKKQQEIAKIRKQKKRRSRKVQEKVLGDKRAKSTIKQTRKTPKIEE